MATGMTSLEFRRRIKGKFEAVLSQSGIPPIIAEGFLSRSLVLHFIAFDF